MVRTGRPPKGDNPLAGHLRNARNPGLRTLLEVAVSRNLSQRQLAILTKRDESALSRSLDTKSPRAKTILELAQALGFPVLVARALAGTMTAQDLAVAGNRVLLALGPGLFSDDGERVWEILRNLHDDPQRGSVYREALAAFVLGGAGLFPDDAEGSPLPSDLAALVAALRRRGYDVGTTAPLDRTRQRLAAVGLALVDAAIGLGAAEGKSLNRALGERAPKMHGAAEIAAIARAAEAAEAAARSVLEAPGLEEHIRQNHREIAEARKKRDHEKVATP